MRSVQLGDNAVRFGGTLTIIGMTPHCPERCERCYRGLDQGLMARGAWFSTAGQGGLLVSKAPEPCI